MPSFSVEVGFEVFCGRCGAGLCNQSDTRESYKRGMPQVVVQPCDTCMEAKADEAVDSAQGEFDLERADLEARIEALLEENASLETELAQLQESL